MAIATKPKLQKHDKKRKALHHRQSQHYLKSYLPYLPMLLVVVVGLAVNVYWASTSGSNVATNNPLIALPDQTSVSTTAANISRIQLLSGGSNAWLLPLISTIGLIILIVWLTTYGLRLRKVIVRGEAFVANHPLLDFVVVSLVVLGWVLTRPI